MQIHPLCQLYRMFLEVIQVCVFDCVKEEESFGVRLELTIQADNFALITKNALYRLSNKLRELPHADPKSMQ